MLSDNKNSVSNQDKKILLSLQYIKIRMITAGGRYILTSAAASPGFFVFKEKKHQAGYLTGIRPAALICMCLL